MADHCGKLILDDQMIDAGYCTTTAFARQTIWLASLFGAVKLTARPPLVVSAAMLGAEAPGVPLVTPVVTGGTEAVIAVGAAPRTSRMSFQYHVATAELTVSR